MTPRDVKRKFNIDLKFGKRLSNKSIKSLFSVGYKYCGTCEDIKKIHKFCWTKKEERKLEHYCKSCKIKKRKAKGRNDYKGHTPSRKAAARKYYLKNKKKILLYNETWKNNNKESSKAIARKGSAKRRAAKLNATPSWTDERKVSMVYKKAEELSQLLGVKMEVDHAIPLQGENVCGLHVWENLQILEKTLNIKKLNKFTGEL
jgi:hypothetical protein